ncbi:MAG: GNAT family N-acetyltransferase [Chloroflexi bacterium]|nr:GNAT family N-acetyltransferase [Chloroflexota bacterium]
MTTRKLWQRAHAPALWIEVLITLLGVASIVFALSVYPQAFPSAALDLTLSRDEVAQRAQTYVAAHGYALDGYEFALTFNEDTGASYFLQRTLGVAETNRRARADKLPLWYWRARWFKPLQKEEFIARLAPDGTVLAFEHQVLENAPGAKLALAQARDIAEKFLREDRQWDLADWENVAASSEERPGGRADHHLEWKRRDFSAGAGELRVTVDVQGDRVGFYSYWLKSPESFTRQFEEGQNRAGFWGTLSYLLGFFGIGIFSIGAFLAASQRGWRIDRLCKGVMIAVGIISALTVLNTLPLAKASYATTEDYTLYWVMRVIGAGLLMVFSATLVGALWTGGRILSRQVWRYQDKILPRGDDRWIILARSSWRGLMLGCLMAGYVVLFYFIATQWFGSWTPLEADYSDLYATPAPFLAALYIGLIPATTEELLFRVAGIPLVLLITRRRVLALLIPGALWAFAHLGYVTDPFYLRGIELTIGAFFLEGLFFYHFDATTTMVAHFAYNAGLTALPLLRSSDPYFVASGLIVIAIMLAPIAPGALRALWRVARGKRTRASQMSVAPATTDDLAALAQFEDATRKWEDALADATQVVLCLRADAHVIGAGIAQMDEHNIARVVAVHIAPAWRRRYWATVLVDELAATMKARGATQIQATSFVADKPATAFWASQNWFVGAFTFASDLAPQPPKNLRERFARHFATLRVMLGM